MRKFMCVYTCFSYNMWINVFITKYASMTRSTCCNFENNIFKIIYNKKDAVVKYFWMGADRMKKRVRKLFLSNYDFGDGQKKTVRRWRCIILLLLLLLLLLYCYYCYNCIWHLKTIRLESRSLHPGQYVGYVGVWHKLSNVRPNGFSKPNPNAVYLRDICADGVHMRT